MEIIYLAAPFRADNEHTIPEHVQIALDFARHLSSPDRIVIVPHTMFPTAEDSIPEHREAVLSVCRDLASRYPLMVCGDRVSSGMEIETRAALEHGQTVHRLRTTGGEIEELTPQDLPGNCRVCGVRLPERKRRDGMRTCSQVCSQIMPRTRPQPVDDAKGEPEQW